MSRMPRVKAKAVSRSGQVRSAVRLTFCSTVLIFVVLPLALDIIVRRELSAHRARSPYSRRGLCVLWTTDSTVPSARSWVFILLSVHASKTPCQLWRRCSRFVLVCPVPEFYRNISSPQCLLYDLTIWLHTISIYESLTTLID